MIDYVSIGKRIKGIRLMRGITQEKLAETVNISVPHVSRIENGWASPSLQTLVDICNALDITIDSLMQDSLPAARKDLTGALGEVVADCTAEELNMLAEIAQSILRSVRSTYKS